MLMSMSVTVGREVSETRVLLSNKAVESYMRLQKKQCTAAAALKAAKLLGHERACVRDAWWDSLTLGL